MRGMRISGYFKISRYQGIRVGESMLVDDLSESEQSVSYEENSQQISKINRQRHATNVSFFSVLCVYGIKKSILTVK